MGLDELCEWVASQLSGQYCILVAESFGGPVAIKTALALKGQVKGLVLSSSFCKSPLPAFMLGFVGLMYPVVVRLPFLSIPLILLQPKRQ